MNRVGDLRSLVLGVEVDDGVEAVAVAVAVGGVGVDVLAQRVGVLDQEAERLRVVGRDERARRGERGGGVLSGGAASRVLNRRADDKDALIYYAQNSTEILKTALYVVVLDKLLTAVTWVVMLGPAFALLWLLPESVKAGGFVGGLVIAALFASNIRQAFLKPLFLVMVMTKFHLAVRNQPINLEWDGRLSGISSKFTDIKDRAAGGWAGAPPVPGTAGR